MKILYIVHDTDPFAGSAKSLISMVDQVKAAGNEIAIIFPNKKGLYQIFKEKGIMVFDMPILPMFFNLKLRKNLKTILRGYYYTYKNNRNLNAIIKEIIDFNPDIVHENTSVTNIGSLVSKRLKKPYVIHIREYGDKDFNWFIHGLKNRLRNKRTFSISITKNIREHVNQSDNPHAFQLYNGIVNLQDFRYTENKKNYILYAGRIEEAKGTFELIETFNKFNEINQSSELKLLLAGEYYQDDYYKRCRMFIEKHRLTDKVEFLGVRKDLQDLMYNALVTVIPSKFEGLGRVMPEAIANGSLCIGKNTGGTKEQLDEGLKFTGGIIAFPYENEEELLKLLIEIHSKFMNEKPFDVGGEYYNIIMRAQEFVKNFFSIESYGKNLISLYTSIIPQKIK